MIQEKTVKKLAVVLMIIDLIIIISLFFRLLDGILYVLTIILLAIQLIVVKLLLFDIEKRLSFIEEKKSIFSYLLLISSITLIIFSFGLNGNLLPPSIFPFTEGLGILFYAMIGCLIVFPIEISISLLKNR